FCSKLLKSVDSVYSSFYHFFSYIQMCYQSHPVWRNSISQNVFLLQFHYKLGSSNRIIQFKNDNIGFNGQYHFYKILCTQGVSNLPGVIMIFFQPSNMILQSINACSG